MKSLVELANTQVVSPRVLLLREGERQGGDPVKPSDTIRRGVAHAPRKGYKDDMQRRGIVDLGSNTARLVDYLVEPGQWYRLVHQIRQPVRLGEGLGRDGLISKAAMRRAEKALELFGQYATSTKLDWLEVLGTSALRDAANRDEFLSRVSCLGLHIEVLSGILISGHRLREGALFQGFIEEPHLIPDIRSFSVQNVLSHYAQPKEHVDQVRRLAGQVFEGLRPLHRYGEREKQLLDAAAVLQDVGLAVNYYRHDRHGGDLVASAPLNGFTHREQVLLALLVRFHLRGKPRLGAYRRLCQPDDEKLLTRLAACLRLADQLDRSRSQTVEDLSVDIGEQEVRVDAYSCRDPRIELDGIEAHESIFESGFCRRLTVRGVVGSTSPE
ncbi:MAG: hypothetical protein WBP10_14620 [Thermoanaerobaculia bacterium]